MGRLNYTKYSEEINQIRNEFEFIIDEIEDNKCKFIKKEYDEDINKLAKKTNFKVAFIGQYSAGKSSIISGLTNNEDVKVGQGITTDIEKEYCWKNIVLVDTPGIGNEVKEHSEIAYRYMDIADLLVYVVTVQGFDELIAKDFRNIAFDMNKSHKMMLIVNKTSLESIKNRPNWEKHTCDVIEPLNLEDLRVTFIDAKKYLRALNEIEPERINRLTMASNFEELEININNFVKDKGILGRLLTYVEVINSYAIRVLAEITIDDNNKSIQELLQRKRFLVEESRKNLSKKLEREIDNLHTFVIDCSNDYVAKITAEADKEYIDSEFELVTNKINKQCEKVEVQIEDIIEKELELLIKEINELQNSQLYKNIMNEINTEVDFDVNINEKREYDALKKSPDAISGIGKFLGVAGEGFQKWCVNAEKTGKGLKVVSGSDAHKFVLKVGEMVGKKFKPYEAVKIADKISKTGKVLAKVGKVAGVAAAVASPFIATFEEYQEGKFEEKIKSARIETRNNFRVWADEIKKNYAEAKNDILSKTHIAEIKDIDNKIKSLSNEEKLKSNQAERLVELQNNLKKLTDKVKIESDDIF